MRNLKPILIIYLILASVLFVYLAVLVKSVPVLPFDLVISKSFQSVDFPGFSRAMTILSDSGWGVPLYASIALITLSLFFLRQKLASIFILLISLLDTGLFFGIAKWVDRPRPSPNLIRVDFPIGVGGFPSGHVLLYTLILGFLIYLTVVKVKKLILKLVLIVVLMLLIIFIGVARIYSGQHWPSDILGGYLLGSIGLTVSIYFYNLFKDRGWPVFLRRGRRAPESR